MTSKPAWLHRLAREVADLAWFDDEGVETQREELHALWSGNGPALMPLAATPLRLSQLLIERLIPVARGPALHARIDVVEQRPLLLIERDDPQHILIALHDSLPPFLWYPAGQDAASLERALRPYAHTADPASLSLSATARGFWGTQETLRDIAYCFQRGVRDWRSCVLCMLSDNRRGQGVLSRPVNFGDVHDADTS